MLLKHSRIDWAVERGKKSPPTDGIDSPNDWPIWIEFPLYWEEWNHIIFSCVLVLYSIPMANAKCVEVDEIAWINEKWQHLKQIYKYVIYCIPMAFKEMSHSIIIRIIIIIILRDGDIEVN